jgi:hypothetical protein
VREGSGGSGGGRTPEEVRASIERTRAELAASVLELRREVEVTIDWRNWVRKNPGPFLMGAFLFGLMLGARDRR